MLIFKKLSFSFNFCIISDTNVHYFPTKVYAFWISIAFLLCLRWNWNKQGGIGRFENDVDFLTSSNKLPWFYFFRIKVTLPYSSYFCLKIITRIYLKIFGNRATNLCQTLPKKGNYSISRRNLEKRWQCLGDITFGNRQSIYMLIFAIHRRRVAWERHSYFTEKIARQPTFVWLF